MPLRLPSVQQGYARSAGESEYPGLWRGLVGAWPFGMIGSGNRVSDFSGRGDFGSLTNSPVWVPGEFGRVIQTTQNGGYVVTNGSLGTKNLPTNPFSFFLRINAGLVANGSPIRKHDLGNNGWDLSIETDGSLTFNVWGYTSDTYRSFSSAGFMSANTWHFVYVGWNTVSTDTTFIVDGKQITVSFTNTGSGSYADDASLPIYFSNPRSASDFDGAIDDACIYNRNLSPSEIRLAYEIPYAPFVKRRRIYGLQAAAPSIFPPNSLALTGVGR